MNDFGPSLKNGELGCLTTYDVEYIFEYLGKKRVEAQLNRLKNKPTMGIPLDRFLTGNGEFGYLSGKGVFFIFSTILHAYFPDEDLAKFLYSKSLLLNESNYYSGRHLNKHWNEHISDVKRKVEKYPDEKDLWSETGESQYWKEYHFFIHSIFDLFPSLRNQPDKASWIMEVFSFYDKNIEIITEKIKKDKSLWPEKALPIRCTEQLPTII
jgi:hypothetical protein